MSVQYKGPWSSTDVAAFLADASIPVRLACVSGDGYPRVVSLWFLAVEGQLQCVTHRDSPVAGLLRRNPRVGFEVAPNEPPYHGVRGQGDALLSPLGDSELLDRLIDKYLAGRESRVARWLLSRRDEELVITVAPTAIFSWDYRERMADVTNG